MTARTEAAKRRTREREDVKREAEAWSEHGWVTMMNWREAQFIGGGKLITKPRDFFGTKDQAGFDLMCVLPSDGQVVGIQVTETPFVQVRSGKADRNAAHGGPPFSLPGDATFSADHLRTRDIPGPLRLVQIITSYSDRKNPERRWWTR